MSGRAVQATVVEELPNLVFRVELDNKQLALAHAGSGREKNFVRLRPGDRVQLELSPRDWTRGRILRKL